MRTQQKLCAHVRGKTILKENTWRRISKKGRNGYKSKRTNRVQAIKVE